VKIGITYNLRDKVNTEIKIAGSPEEAYEEFDSPETIEGIEKALKALGHEVVRLGFGKPAIERFLNNQVDFVFNIAEGYFGKSREAIMPAILEMLRIPYTGPDPLAAALTLDKISAKHVASYSGVATPSYIVIKLDEEINLKATRFPAILKPAWEGSSKGIRLSSKIQNILDMESELKRLKKDYNGEPIIAEHFIEGKEITVAVIGNSEPKLFGMMEIRPKRGRTEDFIYSLEVKRDYLRRVEYQCPPDISPYVRGRLEKAALTLFKAFGCRDICRFDFRIDKSGTPYFLEANALPGLNPVSGDIVIMAEFLGIEYNELIRRIFEEALSRFEKAKQYEDV